MRARSGQTINLNLCVNISHRAAVPFSSRKFKYFSAIVEVVRQTLHELHEWALTPERKQHLSQSARCKFIHHRNRRRYNSSARLNIFVLRHQPKS